MSKKIKILIVEDEVLTAQWMQLELKDVGYDAFKYVTTGEEAIAVALGKKPDLILMDIYLAGKLDGITTVKEIKRSMDIPVIFMTGYSKKELYNKAQEVNPVAYLQKPIEIWEIKPIIESIF